VAVFVDYVTNLKCQNTYKHICIDQVPRLDFTTMCDEPEGAQVRVYDIDEL
jgi:hypothetical protein